MMAEGADPLVVVDATTARRSACSRVARVGRVLSEL